MKKKYLLLELSYCGVINSVEAETDRDDNFRRLHTTESTLILGKELGVYDSYEIAANEAETVFIKTADKYRVGFEIKEILVLDKEPDHK